MMYPCLRNFPGKILVFLYLLRYGSPYPMLDSDVTVLVIAGNCSTLVRVNLVMATQFVFPVAGQNLKPSPSVLRRI
ncbi:Uncharacterised protein [Enterobacter cloacae]|nr:Uncharacterised protein [Enterobacter cloacae]